MKFVCFLAAFTLILSSCKKEDVINQNNNTSSISWKIQGNDYIDNSPVININSSNVLTIDASDNESNVRLIVYNFSSLSNGSEISLNNLTDKAYITYYGIDYTDTQNGSVVFSDILDNKLSGSFNFSCRELVNFQSVTVSDGVFSNITY